MRIKILLTQLTGPTVGGAVSRLSNLGIDDALEVRGRCVGCGRQTQQAERALHGHVRLSFDGAVNGEGIAIYDARPAFPALGAVQQGFADFHPGAAIDFFLLPLQAPIAGLSLKMPVTAH